MPSIESEFSEPTDIMGRQFRDMADAIVFLRMNLDAIAKGKVPPIKAQKYAKEALRSLTEILIIR